MGSKAFVKRAALCAAIICAMFVTASFADFNLQEAGQAFVGTWDSARSGLCGPCTLKVEKIEQDGKAVGTLTTDPAGTVALNGVVLLNDKGKVVLSIMTPGGLAAQFSLPKGRNMDLTFANGRDLAFTKK